MTRKGCIFVNNTGKIHLKEENKNTKTKLSTEELIKEICAFLDEKKAEDIQVMDLNSINSYFNYFIVATANSTMHLRSLVRQIQKNFSGNMPGKFSGFRSDDVETGWVVIDFIDPVVHIFVEEQRKFYDLERLWGDAKKFSVEKK